MKRTLEGTSKYIGSIVKVYGIKTSLLKTKGFKDGNWIRLSDYITREMKKVAPKTISRPGEDCDEGVSQLFCKLAVLPHANTEFSDFHTLWKNRADSYLVTCLRNLNIKLEESNEIDVLYKKILDKWPLLGVLDVYEARNSIDEISAYVQNLSLAQRL
jgi:hypothetical protein